MTQDGHVELHLSNMPSLPPTNNHVVIAFRFGLIVALLVDLQQAYLIM